MAKVKLRPLGGLNLDDDENNIPEGDYIAANNIVFDTSSSGSSGAIKLLESIASTGLTFSGTLKATNQDPSGQIYFIVRTDNTTATIYRLNNTQTTLSAIITYPHSVTSDFTPDIHVLGDMLVWNYCESGTVLSLYLKKYSGTTLNYTLDNLYLQKKTPNNVLTIKKTLTTNAGKQILESNDFQFATRYLYDSGEYSVLSAYSQMFKGEKDTSGYDFTYNFASTPTFVSSIETYVRNGNNGTWRRVDTRTKGDTSAFTWIGQMYDTLDSVTAAKPFDAVPVNAKHIEVAKNRIFLANVQDDYQVTADNKKITIQQAGGNGYSLPAGSSSMYGLTSINATSSETSYDGSGYAKPFANNSTYAIGWAYYDNAMKTRGVEGYTRFSTGTFGYPFIPDITLTTDAGYVKPAWAKYIQLLYTKNLSKSYVYEGYASNVFFELTKEKLDTVTNSMVQYTEFSQNITTADLKTKGIKFVVDLMGMYRAGRPYTAQEGDKITIRVVSSGVGKILNFDILGQKDNLIYCNYNGAEMTCDVIPDPSKLYFEIYSPAQQQEEETLLFYEYGNLVDISAGFSGATFSGGSTFANNKLLGDMVFSKIDLPVYSGSPFIYNSSPLEPIDSNTSLFVTTNVNCGLLGSTTLQQTAYASVGNNSYVGSTINRALAFNSFGVKNEDSATLPSAGTSVKMTGFYLASKQNEGRNLVTLSLNYTYTQSIALQTPPSGVDYSGSIYWTMNAQVYRTPYDNKNNKKLPAVKYGNKFPVGSNNYIVTATGSNSSTFSSTYDIDMSKIGQDVNANDEFWVELSLDFTARGEYTTASVVISSFTSTFTIYGNRTTPSVTTTYNPNAEISSTKASFVLRSISNTTIDQQWNTSAGKPSLAAKDPVSLIRTNAIRYSGNFVYGTKINNINSFFALDSNEVPIENGAITSLQNAIRLQGNGSMILALCERESAYVFLGEQELAQGNNSSIRSLTANFIGTIRNMGGNYGLLDKESVINYKGNIWWWDDFNKKIVKYTSDGIELPSDTKTKSYFLSKSGKAKFSYDPYYNSALVAIGSDTQSLSYSDNRKRWIGAFDFVPDLAESYGDKMILFKNGTIYKSLQSNNKTSYNSFFGTSYDGNIKFVLNSQIPALLKNVAIQHNCSVVDYSQSNNVKASLLQVDITNDNGQATSIKEPNFIIEDNRLYGHVMRDTNSSGGIINGDYIVGYINKFLLTLKDKTQNMRIVSLDVDADYVSGHS